MKLLKTITMDKPSIIMTKTIKSHCNILFGEWLLVSESWIYRFYDIKVVICLEIWELLVTLVIIKLYSRIDIFKQIKEKHEQDILNVVRKYERVRPKFLKVQADIKFIKICKRE